MNEDLISRSALLESMNAVVFRNVPVEHQPYVYAACEAFDAVTKTAPAIDAIEVIRCRNCEHWSALRNFFEIGNCTRSVNTCTPGSFYCADGRRKMDTGVEG